MFTRRTKKKKLFRIFFQKRGEKMTNFSQTFESELQKRAFKKECAHLGACTLTAQFLPSEMFARDVNASTESAALNTRMHNAHMHAFTRRDNVQRREYRLQRKAERHESEVTKRAEGGHGKLVECTSTAFCFLEIKLHLFFSSCPLFWVLLPLASNTSPPLSLPICLTLQICEAMHSE